MREFCKVNIVRRCAAALSLGLVFSGTALAQGQDVKVQSDILAFTISVDEDGRELRNTAETVAPGGVIEYQLTYKNISDEALGGFIIQGAVPETTHYLSADPKLDTRLAVFEVSVEDIGWVTPPVIRYVDDGQGVLRPVEVPEDEYEALRWRLAEPITPGEEVSATYRIRVED